MIPEQYQPLLNALITLVLIPVLPTIAAFIVMWFKAKTDQMRQSIKDQNFYKYFDILDKTVYDVVNGLQQEIVTEWKEASKDGTLTTEEKAEIRDRATKKIVSILGDNGLKILEASYGDIYKAIDSKIHKEVLDLKMKKGCSPNDNRKDVSIGFTANP